MRVGATSVGMKPIQGLSHPAMPMASMAMRLVPLRFGGAAFKEVKLMTYNTENFFAPRGKSLGKSAQSVQALAQVIRKENPDILALQEIEGQNVLDSLNRTELGNAYKILCPVGNNDPRGIKVGYLYKNDITLESWSSHLHTQCGPKPCLLRDALLAKFKFTTVSGATDSLYAITVHLKSMRGGEAKTTPTRVQEAKVVRGIVENVLKTDPHARIAVMGDFNTKSQTQYGQRVMKAIGAIGASPLLIEVFDGKKRIPPTHPGIKQPEKLDYIMMTPNLFKDRLKASVSGSFQKNPWMDASDHLPVVATVNAEASVKPVTGNAPIPFASSARKPLRIYA